MAMERIIECFAAELLILVPEFEFYEPRVWNLSEAFQRSISSVI